MQRNGIAQFHTIEDFLRDRNLLTCIQRHHAIGVLIVLIATFCRGQDAQRAVLNTEVVIIFGEQDRVTNRNRVKSLAIEGKLQTLTIWVNQPLTLLIQLSD